MMPFIKGSASNGQLESIFSPSPFFLSTMFLPAGSTRAAGTLSEGPGDHAMLGFSGASELSQVITPKGPRHRIDVSHLLAFSTGPQGHTGVSRFFHGRVSPPVHSEATTWSNPSPVGVAWALSLPTSQPGGRVSPCNTSWSIFVFPSLRTIVYLGG